MTQHKVYMNQIHGSSLLCELAQMWRNQALCDAIIKAGASTARAHRLVLVAACPMLKSMEGASVGSHLEVRLASDIKEDSIHTFLQYLYEGCMVLTEDNYKDIEKIGRILQVDSVIKCCSDFYKCLNSSSQYKYDYYDHVEFKHVRQTDMLKFSEKSNKRPTDSKSTNQSGKRQKIQNSDSSLFSATSKNDDRSSSSNLKDSVRPYKMGPASVSRRTNGNMDVVEDGVQIHHVDKDSSSGTSQVVDASSAMSVSVASQIQSDVNVQVVNMMNTQSTSSSAGVPRIPTKPPLSGPFTTESPDNRSDSPLFLSRSFASSVVPPSKSFAMGSPTMVPVGPAQFPTFVKETAATTGTEDDVGMKSRSESRSSLITSSPDPSIVKKEPGTSTPGTSTAYVEVQEQGMMMLRRPDTDSELQEEVSSDLEIEEPPPDDSYAGDPGSEASWMGGQAGNDSLTEKGSWHSVDTGRGPYAVGEEQGGEGNKFDRKEMKYDGTDLKFYNEVLPGHRLIRIEGSKKACAYCDIQRLKTKSGWQIKSYFKCLACDIPLCKSDKECFLRYHELRLEQPNVPPKELHKRLKTKNKPLLLHNVTPSQIKSSNTSSPSTNISLEESVTTADIIRAHLSPSDFSEQNPAPPLLTPYLYNTSNVPPLDVDSPEQSQSESPDKSETPTKVNRKEEKQTSREGSARKSRKSVKTKPMKIVFTEEENDVLANEDSSESNLEEDFSADMAKNGVGTRKDKSQSHIVIQ